MHEDKWNFIYEGFCRFAGHEVPLNEEVYVSASETNFRNQGIYQGLAELWRVVDTHVIFQTLC